MVWVLGASSSYVWVGTDSRTPHSQTHIYIDTSGIATNSETLSPLCTFGLVCVAQLGQGVVHQ